MLWHRLGGEEIEKSHKKGIRMRPGGDGMAVLQ